MELYETSRLREVEKFFTRGGLSHRELPQTGSCPDLLITTDPDLIPGSPEVDSEQWGRD